MLANYNEILPKIAVHATTRGRCCSESLFSSFYICSKLCSLNFAVVIYVSKLYSLDICENKWYHLIDAQINIQNMILPHVK